LEGLVASTQRTDRIIKDLERNNAVLEQTLATAVRDIHSSISEGTLCYFASVFFLNVNIQIPWAYLNLGFSAFNSLFFSYYFLFGQKTHQIGCEKWNALPQDNLLIISGFFFLLFVCLFICLFFFFFYLFICFFL
jgi:hypothetical protein